MRLFLATSVLVAHAGPLFGLTLMFSDVAVKLFFIISGFYMSLVLSGKYEGKSRQWTFYSNRFLRLYPAYVLAIVLTFIVFCVAEHMSGAPEKSLLVGEIVGRISGAPVQLGYFSLLVVLIPNIFVFGSDLLWLFHHSAAAGWEFTFGFLAHHAGAVRAGDYLLIAPAWSIGIELWFYLLVPWLSQMKTSYIALLAAASLALRLLMDWQHPWITYFFFPAALCFFLYGMLAHRFWKSALFKRIATPERVWGVAGCGLAQLVFREFIPGFRNHQLLIYIVAVTCLPFTFQAFKSITWDRWVGNMSYPVYLFHVAVIAAIRDFTPVRSTLIIVLVTFVLAFVINYFIEEPLERFRQWRAAIPTVSKPSGSEAPVTLATRQAEGPREAPQ